MGLRSINGKHCQVITLFCLTRQETGDGRRETGDGRRETGDRRQRKIAKIRKINELLLVFLGNRR